MGQNSPLGVWGMRIALIHHSDDLTNDYAAYLASLLDDSAKEKEYIIKDYDHVVNARENIKEDNLLLHIVIPANTNFSLKYWYRFKLPRIFKKFDIDVAVCLYGICTSSSIKQILVVPDVMLLKPQKSMLLWQTFAVSRIKESISNASKILTYSRASAKAINEVVAGSESKINVAPYTAPEIFAPMEWHNKLYVKSRYAQNKEYFIGILPDNDEDIFVELLKAFSKFKKWQQSGMNLVLLPKDESFANSLYKKLDTYKYRNDVNLVNDADKKDTADLIAAAYVLLHPSYIDSELWAAVTALQCNTPIIAYETASIKEYVGDAGLFVPAKDFEAFGDELNKIYKDENLKNEIIERAAAQTINYKQVEIKDKLWQLLTN